MAGFPATFRFGTATAAYQIEGAVAADGRTPSIWDTFSHTPGRTHNGDTGDVACDHYHRWAEDVRLMADLGLDAYRFSIAWPRIIPAPDGAVNRAGLDFYERLVDGLLAAGIDPVVTLYHWDLPQWVQDAGGWPARETTERFAEYAGVVAAALGDRVGTWTTLNEPSVAAFFGYAAGVHAPGETDPARALRVVHHLLLGHGRAVPALRAALPRSAQVSITLNLATARAASADPADVAAARYVDGTANRLFLDPVLRGDYPADVVAATTAVTDWGFVADGDLATIAAGIDVLGVNYYFPHRVAAATPELLARAAALGEAEDDVDRPRLWPGGGAVLLPQQGQHTTMGWIVDPSGFSELLLRLHADYPGVPMMITENGAAFDDVLEPDGSIHDRERIGYLHRHLAAVHEAMQVGADIRGYFAWSLLDNFEWAEGYRQRFGLLHTDYATQERRFKDSAHWYRELIATRTLPPPP